ncbi:hypothetical protein [Picosynechococcus sp. PCC 73109]|uniref:hypothetical protein n=1 Tax=Picosynechococcus sp. PCC 73109 TaxID=374982 RepID=UPI00074583E0|nr:hypothetical protein [Picosynechococcus sp. PCC 73109]AMA07903.1 hypothetical protein AWQ23_00420 [Picosynechococcus sp. PCC 73109]
MTQIYETFLWWLTLWLSDGSDIAWFLDEASYENRSWNFWEAIAPDIQSPSPWDIGKTIRIGCFLGELPEEARLNPVRAFISGLWF